MDELGRMPIDKAALMGIGIFGDYGETVLCRGLPYCRIISAFESETLGVRGIWIEIHNQRAFLSATDNPALH
jgi:hypothetical protein